MNDETQGLTDEQIIDAANAPASMSADGQTVAERSAADVIAFDKYIRSRRVATATPADPFAGMRMGIISPPGTRGRQ